eukprot:jgi/Tetstr1/457780/TSEL_044325.t1
MRPCLSSYLRRFKAKKAPTPEEQVAGRLIYSRVFDTAKHKALRQVNVVDGLLAAPEDKRLEIGFTAAAKAQVSATFKRHTTERNTDRDMAQKGEGQGGVRETTSQAVCDILAGLTSRSPEMMAEPRKLWCLMDNNGVHF